MMSWLLLVAALVALVAGVLADRAVARRSPDRGTFWTRGFWLAGLALGLLVVAAWALPLVALDWWQRAWHPMLDLLHPVALVPHAVALSIGLGAWTLALALGALRGVTGSERGRWLAGSIGFSPSRWWLFWLFTLPLALMTAFAVPRFGSSLPTEDYPGVLLALLALAALTLGFIAASRGRAAVQPAQPGSKAPPGQELADWPEALRKAGIALETLCRWQADPVQSARADADDGPHSLRERAVPRPLREVLLERSDSWLIEAPDDAGQLETLAYHAQRQAALANTVVLLISPDDAHGLQRAMARFLPADDAAVVLDPASLRDGAPGSKPAAMVWIADARTLSDRLIGLFLREPRLFRRIRTVAWWDLHRYSGVLAANFWAISHRFDRLVAHLGGQSLRHVATQRGVALPAAQASAFVNLLLPRRFDRREINLPAGPARDLSLHLLTGCSAPAGSAAGGSVALAAARASVVAGWPTHLLPPMHLDARTLGRFERDLDDARARSNMMPDAVTAGARVLEVDSETLLSLPDIVARTGCLVPQVQVAHVGIVAAFGNPYIEAVLRHLADVPDVLAGMQRRMVAAEPQARTIARHLLLALDELPDTRAGLESTFRREHQDDLAAELRRLADDNHLRRREVRYLADADGDLRVETAPEYHLVQKLETAPLPPLTSVGPRLVDVYDPVGIVVNRVDPERLTIDAYPWRVFIVDGRRYRVRQWDSADDVAGPDGSLRLICEREDAPVKTWRVFHPAVTETAPGRGRRDVHLRGTALTRSLVTTVYQERLTGVLTFEQDAASGRWVRRNDISLPPIRSLPLKTTGMLLHVPVDLIADLPRGLQSVAAALRHVCPVHVGVAEDAVAILPFHNEPVGERIACGVLVVDLYPGGIGLTQSIDEDPDLFMRLLRHAQQWLKACTCDSESGCERCLQSPLSLSTCADRITMSPSRGDALGLLERMLGA